MDLVRKYIDRGIPSMMTKHDKDILVKQFPDIYGFDEVYFR